MPPELPSRDPPLTRFSRTSDIEAQSALLEGWTQSCSQLSGGAFPGELAGAHLFREATCHSLLRAGQLGEGMVAVGLLLGTRGPASFCGAPCGGSRLHLFPGATGSRSTRPKGSTWRSRWSRGGCWPPGSAGRTWRGWDGRSFWGWRRRPLPGCARCWRSCLAGARRRRARCRPGRWRRFRAIWRSCLLAEPTGAAAAPEGGRAGTLRRRMEVIAAVRAAVELADGKEVLDIELLCQRIGISRRTLPCACEEELGSRPAACIRALRLSRG